MGLLRCILSVLLLLALSPVEVTATNIDPWDAVTGWQEEPAPNLLLGSGASDWLPLTHGGIGLPPGVSLVIANAPGGPQNFLGSLVSDFIVNGNYKFSGYMRARSENINAGSFGVVFGWQDYDDTYFIEWSGSNEDTLPKIDPQIKIKQVLNGVENTYYHDLMGWDKDIWYYFEIESFNNDLSLLVTSMDLSTEILSAEIENAEMLSGSIGLWGINQYAEWAGLKIESTPIPEPATMFLLGSGMIGLTFWGRKKFLRKG